MSAELEIILEEEHSVDLFSDVESSQSTNNVANSDCKNLSTHTFSALRFCIALN